MRKECRICGAEYLEISIGKMPEELKGLCAACLEDGMKSDLEKKFADDVAESREKIAVLIREISRLKREVRKWRKAYTELKRETSHGKR